MTRLSNVTALITSTFFASVLLAAGAPEAHALQNKDEQACVNALNKAGAKVASTQGKENSGCVKAGGSGSLDNPTVDACIAADNKGKVGGAQTKTSDAELSKCTDTPTFAFTGAAITNAAAESEEVALVQAVFGNPVDPAIIVGGDGAKCQAGVAKTLEKLAATRMKNFNACKKTRLKETANDASQLLTCITDDPKSKFTGAVAKLTDAIQSCQDDSIALATAFPGCTGETGSVAALSGCIERKVECKMCLLTNTMDALTNACDQIDDGVVNQTCRQCGNNLQEAPEPCDTAGDSATCDFDCTVPSCGDAHTNAAAGEACDDGNGSNTDLCVGTCDIAICGDGFTCSGVGCTTGPSGGVEACDDGNMTNGDGCDNNCSVSACQNGITAGAEQCDDGNAIDTDSCRNSCVLATCGDGVTCVGMSCTTGPMGGAEACDDGDLDNTDSCLTTCAAASCGDGFLCSDGGCTTGHTGGIEQCDNAGANSNVVPDACRTNCRTAYCGDGVDDTPEACDGAGETAGCDDDCTLPVCPDGNFNAAAGEACDDGNMSDNDSCVGTCDLATCGDGFLCSAMGCTTGHTGGTEQCDDNGANSNVTVDACRTNCRTAYCGDNVTDTGETCDTAGNSMTCDSDCTTAACGDGFVNSANSETCDGGGETMTCDANCTAAVCGDGTINATAGENCDDSNAMSGDGCSSVCLNGPGSGEQDAQCPNVGELTLFSKTTNQPCTDNTDCTFPRFCDTSLTLPRCGTVADLDSGWNGAGHDSDINDQVTAMADLLCEGPNSPGCGECEVEGLNPAADNCRCANNILTICDEPFVADSDDCGGNICNCWFGAPFPLSAQGTPVCVSNRFSEDIYGTADPDLGAGQITANLRTQVFLGYSRDMPCPVCGGKCSNDNSGCIFDTDCTMGATCVQDTPNDGIRDGLCIRDPDFHTDDGVACEVTGQNASFPAVLGDTTPGQGGGGYSIDCQPDVGKNVTGAGLKISLSQTTGVSSLGFGVDCDGSGVGTDLCPCLVCSVDTTTPCDANADCAVLSGTCTGTVSSVTCDENADCASVDLGPCGTPVAGRCNKKTSQVCANNSDCQNINVSPCNPQTCTAKGATGTLPQPNFCSDDICTDEGGGEGSCAAGPAFKYCDALVKADGQGASSCLSNADCTGGYGTCTVIDQADCFLDPIVASGAPDPVYPVAGAVFCIAPTSNTGVNSSAGLPGPGRVTSQGFARTFCASDNNVQYTPGGTPACP